MGKKITKLLSLVVLLLVINIALTNDVKASTAGVPLSITVNGSLLLTDAGNDSMSGQDPTLNVNIAVTPDLGSSTASGSANFRVRTNNTNWRVTAQRTASNAGGTGIADSDVKVDIATSAGSTGNASAGALVAPFNAQTNLASIPSASAADVINGTAKTSSAKDGSNTNNYFQVNTTYSIAPDFFFSTGTYSTTITYSVVSP